MENKETIPFEGNYWWGDSENVTSVVESKIKEILGGLRLGIIEIRGTDFNDGREARKATIKVQGNEITIEKSF